MKKLLTLKDFDKVLISYIYEKDTLKAIVDSNILGLCAKIEVIKGKKRGVIVALGNGIIGWSLCKATPTWTKKGWEPADTFNKEQGLSLALNRANIASALSVDERESFYTNVPFSIVDEFEKMKLRSEKYFNRNTEEEC